MARYYVAVVNVDGRYIQTEDEEEPVKEWLWRTMKHLRETWPAGATFDARIAQFNEVRPGG